jgi:hypothetical protein
MLSGLLASEAEAVEVAGVERLLEHHRAALAIGTR